MIKLNSKVIKNKHYRKTASAICHLFGFVIKLYTLRDNLSANIRMLLLVEIAPGHYIYDDCIYTQSELDVYNPGYLSAYNEINLKYASLGDNDVQRTILALLDDKEYINKIITYCETIGVDVPNYNVSDDALNIMKLSMKGNHRL